MKIERIEISHHALPLDPPFQAAWDSRPRATSPATIVRVYADGLVGIGSGDAMVGFAGHEDLFVGQDALALERHFRVLGNIDFHYGRCWALDLALWDLAGKIAGLPVFRLLGGLTDRLAAYASSGVLRAPEALADLSEQIAGRGIGAMKIRFHRPDWREDLAMVEAVRARLGDRLTLMVDCNQAWRMPWDTATPWRMKDALAVARALDEFGVYWMEEPLDRADRSGMRALRHAAKVRIAGGEMTRNLDAFRDLLAEGALDVIQPDAALVGGITGLRKVAALAEAHGAVFTPHTWSNGIGLIANAHLTAGTTGAPFLEYPEDPDGWSIERRDWMLAEPIGLDDRGDLVLSDRPGFGFTLDEERLAAHRLD
jgi:L-alanine-DL-glutamate epimerase-like enolase superfamily enzyme